MCIFNGSKGLQHPDLFFSEKAWIKAKDYSLHTVSKKQRWNWAWSPRGVHQACPRDTLSQNLWGFLAFQVSRVLPNYNSQPCPSTVVLPLQAYGSSSDIFHSLPQSYCHSRKSSFFLLPVYQLVKTKVQALLSSSRWFLKKVQSTEMHLTWTCW